MKPCWTTPYLPLLELVNRENTLGESAFEIEMLESIITFRKGKTHGRSEQDSNNEKEDRIAWTSNISRLHAKLQEILLDVVSSVSLVARRQQFIESFFNFQLSALRVTQKIRDSSGLNFKFAQK